TETTSDIGRMIPSEEFSVSVGRKGPEPAELVGEDLWRGVLPDPQLLRLSPPDGIIRSQASWRLLWKYWGGGVAAPAYDPATQIALVATVPGRRTQGTPLIWPDGRVEFAVGGTTELCEGVGYQIALISSEGIRRINGKPYRSDLATEWIPGEIRIPSELATFTKAKVTISLYRTSGRRTDLPAERIAEVELEDISHERWEGEKAYGFGVGGITSIRPGVVYYVEMKVESEEYRERQFRNVEEENVVVFTMGE
ncbi:MAG: hypothetical protein Q4C47_04645, partial [Planctomycetia bacterium]|nr:hypothetical protein [Planctomycetia bacterium]